MKLFEPIKNVLTRVIQPSQLLDSQVTVGSGDLDTENHSEDILIRAEMFNMSPEEVLRQEAKRKLYERIAFGNAMAEVDHIKRKTL